MAKGSFVILGLVMLFAGIFSTATTAIGIQAYNKDELSKFKEDNKNNFNFLIINLVSALLVIIIASVVMYFGIKNDAPAPGMSTDMSSM